MKWISYFIDNLIVIYRLSEYLLPIFVHLLLIYYKHFYTLKENNCIMLWQR